MAIVLLLPPRAEAQSRPLAVPQTAAQRAASGPAKDRGRREAAALLQASNIHRSRNLFLDSSLVEEVVRALRVVRAKVPGLPDPLTDAESSVLELWLIPQATAVMLRQPHHDANGGVVFDVSEKARLRLGLTALDSLNDALGVREAFTTFPDSLPPFVLLGFPAYMQMPLVAARYEKLPFVVRARPQVIDFRTNRNSATLSDLGNGRWRLTSVHRDVGCADPCEGFTLSIVDYDRKTGRAVPIGQETVRR
jgi:hypothetical protein